MPSELIRTEQEIKNSLLTTEQRKFLQSNISNTDRSRVTRSRIRERVREGLRDFQILADHLETRDRDLIFDAKPRTREYAELQEDVFAAIELMYAGLGGETGFRRPLMLGVRNGEVELGHIDSPLNIMPRFTVDVISHVEGRTTIQAVENREWDRLMPHTLLAFLQLAERADAIDFEKIYDRLDRDQRLVNHRKKAKELEKTGDTPLQGDNQAEE